MLPYLKRCNASIADQGVASPGGPSRVEAKTHTGVLQCFCREAAWRSSCAPRMKALLSKGIQMKPIRTRNNSRASTSLRYLIVSDFPQVQSYSLLAIERAMQAQGLTSLSTRHDSTAEWAAKVLSKLR